MTGVTRALGLDLGQRRIGVAVCDDNGVLATPFDTIQRVGDQKIEHTRILELLDETGAQLLVVGVPYSLDGGIGPAATTILAEIRGIEKKLKASGRIISVKTQDERFTTVTASEALSAGGVKKRKQRTRIDASAAAVLLQAYLDGQH